MGLTNQIKTVLPWLCLVALAAAMLVLRARSNAKETELSALRQGNQELNEVRAENEELKKIRVDAQELDKLRKENEELHRLRNEVRQLREEKQQAARVAQPALSPVAPGKSSPTSPPPAELLLQFQQLMTENERLRAENQQYQQLRVAEATAQANACINNLRQIDGAKQQWALENKKPATAVPAAQEIQPYLRNNQIPACPLGGVYTLNAVEAVPTCSIPGHVIPSQ